LAANSILRRAGARLFNFIYALALKKAKTKTKTGATVAQIVFSRKKQKKGI
jgi:hypothetical protein